MPVQGGTPGAWATRPQLARTSFLGAKGIAIHDDAIWVSNTDQGTIVRIPILPGGAAGPIQTVDAGLGVIDNFIFVPGTDEILAALPVANEVTLIENGQATGADGLSSPSSVEIQDDTLHLGSAAMVTGSNPNLLVAQIDR